MINNIFILFLFLLLFSDKFERNKVNGIVLISVPGNCFIFTYHLSCTLNIYVSLITCVKYLRIDPLETSVSFGGNSLWQFSLGKKVCAFSLSAVISILRYLCVTKGYSLNDRPDSLDTQHFRVAK